jgi:hypothetical protein
MRTNLPPLSQLDLHKPHIPVIQLGLRPSKMDRKKPGVSGVQSEKHPREEEDHRTPGTTLNLYLVPDVSWVPSEKPVGRGLGSI